MPVPDRQRQRREYLRKIGIAKGKMGCGIALLLASGFVFLGCCATTFFFLLAWLAHPGEWAAFGINALVTVLFGYVLFRSIQFYDHSEQEQATIAYVPPVTEKTLPSEEILLRGSEEPLPEQSRVLLRAAKDADAPARELLRVSIDDPNLANVDRPQVHL